MFRTTGCGVTATCTMLVKHWGQIASVSIGSEGDILIPLCRLEAPDAPTGLFAISERHPDKLS